MAVVTAVGVRHMDTHGVVKLRRCSPYAGFGWPSSFATGSGEAVPVEGLLSLRPHNTLRFIVTYIVPAPLKMNSRISPSVHQRMQVHAQ